MQPCTGYSKVDPSWVVCMVLCLYTCSQSKQPKIPVYLNYSSVLTLVMVLPNVSWLFFAFYNIFVHFHAHNVRIGHFKHGLQQQLFLQENRGRKYFCVPSSL